MHKADYIKIANVIVELSQKLMRNEVVDEYDLIEYFSAMLSEDNPNFDAKKFVEYIEAKANA